MSGPVLLLPLLEDIKRLSTPRIIAEDLTAKVRSAGLYFAENRESDRLLLACARCHAMIDLQYSF